MKLLTQARESADQAEVFVRHRKSTLVRFAKNSLRLVADRDTSECALRVVQQGQLGASFGESPDQPELLRDALSAASFGQAIPFRFAERTNRENVICYDRHTAALTAEALIELGDGVRRRVLAAEPDAVVNLHTLVESGMRHIASSEGVDAEEAFSRMELLVELPFPSRGTDIGAAGRLTSIHPVSASDEWIESLLEQRHWGNNPSRPSTGRWPVLLTPYASNLLTLALAAGLSGAHVAQGASPLADKVGQQILSQHLTIHENPRHPNLAFRRSFDDEGTPVSSRPVIERGVLRGFLTDLRTSAMLDCPSSGSAVRRTLFSEKIEDAPSPGWLGAVIEPGDRSWRDLLAGIEEGLLVTHMLGLHSCNLLQGQYTVQANGFHVRNGVPVGYLERTMLSGNLYEDFLSIRAISSEREPTTQGPLSVAGLAPYLLLESAQITVG